MAKVELGEGARLPPAEYLTARGQRATKKRAGPPRGTRSGSRQAPISDWHFQVGQRLMHARLAKNWSQFDLATELGLKQLQISKFENGLSDMGIAKATVLANALGVSMDYFLLQSDVTK